MKKFAVMAVAAAAAMGAAQVQAASIIDDFTAAQVVQDLTTGDGGTWGTVPNRPDHVRKLLERRGAELAQRSRQLEQKASDEQAQRRRWRATQTDSLRAP